MTLDGKSSTKQLDLFLGPRLVKTLMNARLGVQICKCPHFGTILKKSPREPLLSYRSGEIFQNCTNVRTNFGTSKSFILTVAIKVLIAPTHKDHITVHVNQDIMEMERLALKMMLVLEIDVVQWDCVLTF